MSASVNDGKPPLFQKIITDNMQRYQDGEIDYWTVPVPLGSLILAELLRIMGQYGLVQGTV